MISSSLGGRMPRVVMLVGPCGAGKSSALQRMRPVLGSRVGEVAVLETDTTYMMIDPTWSVYNSHYDSIAKRAAARIAADFVCEGFDWVAVGSNGLQDRAGVDDFVAHLPDGVEVYHVFLDPSVAAVQDRIAARAHPLDAEKTPEWLEGNVAWMRTFHDSWSALIDNSDLGVDETVNAIYETVESGRGKIRRSTPAQQDLAAVDIAYRVDKAVDVAAWLRLFHACGWNSDWTARNAKVMLEHAYLVVTARLGGEIVGTLTVLSDGLNYATIDDVLVHPDYRGKGVGSRMVRIALERVARLELHLEAVPGMAPFYEKLGFIPNHGHVGMYRPRGDG